MVSGRCIVRSPLKTHLSVCVYLHLPYYLIILFYMICCFIRWFYCTVLSTKHFISGIVGSEGEKKFENTLTRFDTIHEHDGQTPHDGIGCAIHVHSGTRQKWKTRYSKIMRKKAREVLKLLHHRSRNVRRHGVRRAARWGVVIKTALVHGPGYIPRHVTTTVRRGRPTACFV